MQSLYSNAKNNTIKYLTLSIRHDILWGMEDLRKKPHVSQGEQPGIIEQAPRNELLMLRDTAVEAALVSAKIAMQIFEGRPLEESKFEWKLDDTPKTRADVEGDFRIVEIIRDKFPQDDIIIEESGHHKGLSLHQEKAKRTWHGDSLDGSRPFVEGKPEFTVGVQVEDEKGNYLAAAIVHPGRRQLIYAIRGFGTYMIDLNEKLQPNSEPIKIEVSQKPTLKGGTICVDSLFTVANHGKKHAAQTAFENMAVDEQGKITLSYDMTGSNIAYQADVARGASLIGLTDCVGGIWDLKVGEAIISEAGGIMVDAQTGQKPTNETVVAIYGNKTLILQLQPQIAAIYEGYQGFSKIK